MTSPLCLHDDNTPQINAVQFYLEAFEFGKIGPKGLRERGQICSRAGRRGSRETARKTPAVRPSSGLGWTAISSKAQTAASQNRHKSVRTRVLYLVPTTSSKLRNHTTAAAYRNPSGKSVAAGEVQMLRSGAVCFSRGTLFGRKAVLLIERSSGRAQFHPNAAEFQGV